MPVYETFSKRQQRLASQGVPVLYQYDDLPRAFRVQVVYIWREALGSPMDNRGQPAVNDWSALWGDIEHTIEREHGLFIKDRVGSSAVRCEDFRLNKDTDSALDIIELSFRHVDTKLREPRADKFKHVITTQSPDEAIAELNHRFREHGIGFQFMGGQLVRVDLQYIHNQVVEPALLLLHVQGFQGPEDEFLRAHEHYRQGKNKEAIVEALKAFESTMKAICDERRWHYSPTGAAKDLINVLFDNGLIPSYLQSQFTSLRASLESRTPHSQKQDEWSWSGKQSCYSTRPFSRLCAPPGCREHCHSSSSRIRR